MQSILTAPPDLEALDFSWKDEVEDEEVLMLESLIEAGHNFKESDFVGGDTSMPKYIRDEKDKKGKKHVKP